ncbi:DUF3021 domain-containing protein [Clostridium sp. Marseille-Q2269]|uniref:DUF3021 domain-containing protein n=1 Tax=Clostridium sp. Marseille-Q2269 TaxID=2942205 RepID=UPI002074A65E|nr:DUF3021 domain-containing protein [Clostridium sp. Marseille-Q2269]
MHYLKKGLKRGLYGITIGVFINQIIFAIIALKEGLRGTVDVNMMFNQFIISVILGFGLAALSIVFDVEHWSSLKQTVAHFIIFSFIYFPIAIYGGWMPGRNIARLKFVAFYIIIYIVAWFILKAYWKRKAIEINKTLELRRK